MFNNKDNIMLKRLFHISPIDNLESIKEKGLLLNDDGELFLFDETDFKYYKFGTFKVSELIACNQLFLKDYIVVEVEVDDKELIGDAVAECTRDYQYISYYPIEPSQIKSITIGSSERYINTMQKIYDELENK
jgi:hypothetical protein